MKLLRSSPFKFFAVACLLHSFIFSCCDSGTPAALRHCDINFCRSSPFKPLSVACLLQSFIFCCCACCAGLGCLVSWAIAGKATAASITRASTLEILRCRMRRPLCVVGLTREARRETSRSAPDCITDDSAIRERKDELIRQTASRGGSSLPR